MPSRDLRRARIGATAAFATNGAVLGALLARYAEVKDLLGVGEAVFGLLVVGFGLGAVVAFGVPGALIRRLGTRAGTVVGTASIALGLLVAAVGAELGSAPLFLLGLVIAGASDPVVDVAQNAQGLQVQRAYGRSVLTSMHAGWSVGAAAGSAVSTLAATAQVPLGVHLAIWGALCTLLMAASGRWFLPDEHPADAVGGESAAAADGAAGVSRRRYATGAAALRLLAPLMVLGMVGVSFEDFGMNWSAVLLSTERGVAVSAAGIGLSALLAAQFVGRLLGDRVLDAVGHRRAMIGSLVLAGVGMVLALWSPWAWSSVVGLMATGLGSAVIIPVTFARADVLPGLRPHSGVTWVSWSYRVTALALSPLIGVVAGATSLPAAGTLLVTVPTAVVLVALLAGAGRSGRDADR